MPAMNGTGPQGAGPMTGRGLGRCNTTDAAAPAYGRGLGRGMGRGRGYNNCGRGFGLGNRGFYAAPEITPEQQKDILTQQKSFIEKELQSIDEQINKL